MGTGISWQTVTLGGEEFEAKVRVRKPPIWSEQSLPERNASIFTFLGFRSKFFMLRGRFTTEAKAAAIEALNDGSTHTFVYGGDTYTVILSKAPLIEDSAFSEIAEIPFKLELREYLQS